MSKILASLAAGAVVAMLALPANAAERRADGLRSHDLAAPTEFSSRHRRFHRRHFVVRRAWGPRIGFYPSYRPYYYRPWYAGYPYRSWWGGPGYGYGYGPTVSFGFGFGPRWGW